MLFYNILYYYIIHVLICHVLILIPTSKIIFVYYEVFNKI